MTSGGEDTTIERLIQSAAALAAMCIVLAVAWASQSLWVPRWSQQHFLSRILQSAGFVQLALGTIAWWMWLTTVRRPPFAENRGASRLMMAVLAAWWICAMVAAYVIVFPRMVYDLRASLLLFAIAPGALLPVPIAFMTFAQQPTSRYSHWQRRLQPTILLACALCGVIAVIGLILALQSYPLPSWIERALNPIVTFLWRYGVASLLAALAIAQLVVLRHAATAMRSIGWRGRLRRVLTRRAWCGALVLPGVFIIGMIASIAVALSWAALPPARGPQTFVYSHLDYLAIHFSAPKELSRRVTQNAESAVRFFGALVGIAAIWVGATFAPLLVVSGAAARKQLSPGS